MTKVSYPYSDFLVFMDALDESTWKDKHFFQI